MKQLPLPQTTPEEIALAEQEWPYFKPLFCEGDEVDLQRLKLLISSCAAVSAGVSIVYKEITGGVIDDPCAAPRDVIEAYRRHLLTVLDKRSKTTQ